MTRQRWIAALWVAGIAVPSLVAAVFVIGCCVLPFHGVMHRVMPLCAMATDVISGEQGDDHQHDARTAPVPSKQEPVKRVVKFLRPSGLVLMTAAIPVPSLSTTRGAYRSFIALGAARCDDDVGARLAGLATLRI